MKWIPQLLFLCTALTLPLAACGSGSETPPGTGDQQAPSVAEALVALEDANVLPRLDRTASLGGADEDGDGVRDDIAAFLATLDDSEEQKAALSQVSAVLGGGTLLGGGTPELPELRANSNALGEAMGCLVASYADGEHDVGLALVRKVTVNTPERFAAYLEYDAQLDGLALRMPATAACATVPPLTGATHPSLCDNRGYVIGYFNGVGNDGAAARASLEALRAIIGETYDDEPVRYELFRNRTGSEVNSNVLQDLAEVFVQRANELDTSGSLAARFEFLWEAVSDRDTPFWNRLIEAVPAARDALDALREEIRARFVGAIADLLSNPPTIEDYDEHRSRLDELALQGQKMLLVAHSQGNLFVNPAFDYIAPKVDPGSVRVVHVAPASSTLRGPYVLANVDVVINGLGSIGVGGVPESNLDLPFATSDPSGHGFVGSYLDPARPGRAILVGMLNDAMDSLVTPVADGSVGFFTVTLTWNGTGDVDLHTFEPDGTHVYYASPTGASGYLDVDNVVADGPEHYFATCDEEQLQVGTYTIGINNYFGATGRTATVQVAWVHGGVLLTRSLGVGPELGSGGNANPIQVFRVIVSKDAEGNYSVAAEQ